MLRTTSLTFQHSDTSLIFLKRLPLSESGGFLLPEDKSQLKHAERVFFNLHVITPNFASSLIKL